MAISSGLIISSWLSLALFSTSVIGNNDLEAHLAARAAECSPYSYPPVEARLTSFPAPWQVASIRPEDRAAIQAWESIASSVPPHIPLKTVPSTQYSSDDPDCWWTYEQCVTPKHPNIPNDVASVPQPRTLGYGFDDGPNCLHDPFYNFLLDHNQKATMFFVGSNILEWPREARRAFNDGHEICLHTWSHPYMTTLSNENAFAELYYSIEAARLVMGIRPNCWRPPFGDIDDRIRAIAHGLGLATIMWKYDTNDWKAGSGIQYSDVDANYEKIISEAENGAFNSVGAIILMHELNNFTMSEAMKFYPRFEDVFDNIIPVGEAIDLDSH